MSSAANSSGNEGDNGGDVASFQPYLCNRCYSTVLITSSPPSELLCPNCNDGFIPNINRHSVSPTGTLSWSPIHFSFYLVDHTRSDSLPGPPEFLQMDINTMANVSSIQLVFDNNTNEDYFEIPINLRYYYFNLYITPPTWRPSATQDLPDINITSELLASSSSNCAICKENFELDEGVKQMPCKHIYHSSCILLWLERNNSCPICRYGISTENPDYENRIIGNPTIVLNVSTASGFSAFGVTGEGSDGRFNENPQTSRRVIIPWQVWYRAEPAVTSNSTGVENNAGYRVVNAGTTSISFDSSVTSQVSGGTSNDQNPGIGRGFRIQIRMPFLD